MRPLTADDLLPLEEYVARRAEFFEAHVRYCDRYRRLRVGPSAVVLFENRQTLWFRVQEILRVARLSDPDWVRRELDVFNRLLPRANCLQAGLLFADEDLPNRIEGSAASVALVLDSIAVPARLISCRPEDTALGLAHWLEFGLSRTDRKLLADYRVPVWMELNRGAERRASDRMSEEMRQSLLDDLEMSDRDAA